MSNQYPERNPFPHQGTDTVEGTRVGSHSKKIPFKVPTLLLNPIMQTVKLSETYFNRFGLSEKGEGQYGILKGEHGSGKTHAVHYVMAQIDKGEFKVREGILEPYQIYVQTRGPDFLALYKEIVKQINIAKFKDLTSRFLGVVAGEEFEDCLQKQSNETKPVIDFEFTHVKASRYFKEYLVDKGVVEKSQEEEFNRKTGGMEDFYNALSYLSDPKLNKVAYEWILGNPIELDDRKRLGVSTNIQTAEIAKWAIQLFTTLFARVGQPLIIYIDQYENLLIDKDSNPLPQITQNLGILRSLVDVIPRENGMLVLSGNTEAWQALARDLKTRFAQNLVDFSALNLNQAENLVSVYLNPGVNICEDEDEGSESCIFPYTQDGVKIIHEQAGGNIRRFLQICYDVFEEAFRNQKKINFELVKDTIKKGSSFYYDESTVLSDLEKILAKRSLRFTRNYQLGQTEIDLSVIGEDGNPRLFIEVKKALFYVEEAKHALASLNVREEIYSNQISARFALIVLGYVSPEVERELSGIVDKLIIYKGSENFSKTFHEFLDQLKESTSFAAPKEIELLTKQLNEVRFKLENISHSRVSDADTLNESLMAFFKRQEEERAMDRHKAAYVEKRKTRLYISSLAIVVSLVVCIPLFYWYHNQLNERNERLDNLLAKVYVSEGPPALRTKYLKELITNGIRSFSAINLNGIDLRSHDLKSIDFSMANLEGARLMDANLRDANLDGANLEEASLEWANLEEASLYNAHLTRAVLYKANLRKADLMRANLREANLEGANLEGANLRETNLEGARLMDANLRETNLEGARLMDANLVGTILDDVKSEDIIKTPKGAKFNKEIENIKRGE
ncbi:pentapeptide repeat-containing protein [candidate division WWE3 bacterium]|nr:pentapeptide repeat-containing protein [candidate division WWE3 bacterium]